MEHADPLDPILSIHAFSVSSNRIHRILAGLAIDHPAAKSTKGTPFSPKRVETQRAMAKMMFRDVDPEGNTSCQETSDRKSNSNVSINEFSPNFESDSCSRSFPSRQSGSVQRPTRRGSNDAGTRNLVVADLSRAPL